MEYFAGVPGKALPGILCQFTYTVANAVHSNSRTVTCLNLVVILGGKKQVVVGVGGGGLHQRS